MSDLNTDPSAPIWAVIPAAGIGQRMQSSIPKQYLSCAGKPVLQHSIERLLDVERVRGIVIALNPADEHWATLRFDTEKPIHTVTGGNERADSVRLALEYLNSDLIAQDTNCMVLVHDAVRPCVHRDDIDRLIDSVNQHASGAILAARVKDTMKRSDANDTVRETVDREHLWHALTPQLFALDDLLSALQSAAEQAFTVTDEASAMEQAGHSVQLVESSASNLKITRPEDLKLAEFYLHTEHQGAI